MNQSFQPSFLSNSPGTICDQILYLVKNSNLNFELHETPFSFNLNLKKSFVHHWKKTDNSAQNNPFSQTHLPHHPDNEPVHQPHHVPQQNQPSVVQPQGNSLHQTQNLLSSNNYFPKQPHQVPQQQLHVPYDQVHHLNHHSDAGPLDNLQQNQASSNLLQQIESIRSEHEAVLKENLTDYADLDKAHRKLVKENRELQNKHTKVCSEVKTLKLENETIFKESNSLSVALKSSKRDLEISIRNSEKEKEAIKKELVDLQDYKAQHQEEIRKAKKLEKKTRQKAKKKLSKSKDETTEPDSENVCISAQNNLEENVKLFEQEKGETGEEVPSFQTETSDNFKDHENNLEVTNVASIAVEEAELVHSDQTEEEIAQKRSEAAKASVEPKDNVNNLELKTEESRFLNFPSNFADWSEDQKKDAYNNNFKLYVQKYYFIGSLPQ